MDTQHTSCSSPTPTERGLHTTRVVSLRLSLTTAAVVLSSIAHAGQAADIAAPRSSGGRHRWVCGGDALDGVCSPECSGNPLDVRYDADCFSCGQLEPPRPKRACKTPGQPCEIHEGIVRMGSMVETGTYEPALMHDTVLAYWSGGAWDLAQNWGASALDGYVVYSVVRAALDFRDEVEQRPTTRMALECMLHDYASRGIPTTVKNGQRRFHGGRNPWNSWSEDYIGFALGLAAADAWLATTPTRIPYDDRYFSAVGDAVNFAFAADPDGPLALTIAADPDPKSRGAEPVVMLRNHNEYSPVYATVLLKHFADVNDLYVRAGLPPRFTCADKPDTLDDLYHWVTGKIEPNPNGAGYVFRDGACERRDGVLSYCDDRPGDPRGTAGFQREPGHYPLARSLADLCIADSLEIFSAPCAERGPAGIEQAPHNYVFNCVFPDHRP